MLIVHADDSSDEKGERFFSVAGVMGTQEEWNALEIDWLKRTGGKIFHATDCESGYGDYKEISKDYRLKEYKDLTQILAKSKMIGFCAVVNIEDYKISKLYDLKYAPYFECFVTVVLRFVKLARVYIPQQQTVKFIIDNNHNVQHNAAYLYEEYLAKRPEYKEYTSFMDRELGVGKSDKIGIQVADLFSHEAMKHCDNIYGPIKRQVRKSIDVLFDTGRYKLRYYDREDFDAFNIKYESLKNMNQEDYNKWLSRYRRKDNAKNRISYLIYLESVKDSDS